MGEKYKITGQMLDMIVSMRNDQSVNYAYKDIKQSIKDSFNCDLSINAIRMAYLKNQNRIVNNVENIQQKAISDIPKPIKVVDIKKTIESELPDNGLRAKVVTDNEKNSLLDELKNF